MAIAPAEYIFFKDKRCTDVYFEGHFCDEAWMEVDGQLECVWRKGNGPAPSYLSWGDYVRGGYALTQSAMHCIYEKKDGTLSWAVPRKRNGSAYTYALWGNSGPRIHNNRQFVAFTAIGSRVSGASPTCMISFDGYIWHDFLNKYTGGDYNKAVAISGYTAVEDGFILCRDNDIDYVKVIKEPGGFDIEVNSIPTDSSTKYLGTESKYAYLKDGTLLRRRDPSANRLEYYTVTKDGFFGPAENFLNYDPLQIGTTTYYDTLYDVVYHDDVYCAVCKRQISSRDGAGWKSEYFYGIKTSRDLIHWSDMNVYYQSSLDNLWNDYRGHTYDAKAKKHYFFAWYGNSLHYSELIRLTTNEHFSTVGYNILTYNAGWALDNRTWLQPTRSATAPSGFDVPIQLDYTAQECNPFVYVRGKWEYAEKCVYQARGNQNGVILDSLNGTPTTGKAFIRYWTGMSEGLWNDPPHYPIYN